MPGPTPSRPTWPRCLRNRASGYYDERAGQRLRKEIYEPGDSRDVNVSIEKFLGRPRSLEPFLQKIGIGKPTVASRAGR